MEVIFASSYDEKHPPNNILNGNKKNYFSSTGMFPQEIDIQFTTEKTLSKVAICSYGIKKIEIQTCANDSAMQFDTQASQAEVPGGGIQNINLALQKNPRTKVLKIIVHEGYDDFFAILTVSI
ncbi:MAG: discoidin domain-containing protein [archaeon]|nr:discoidin domain-containing protein [archaeon]